MKKRLLCAFLALALVFSMLPLTVRADAGMDNFRQDTPYTPGDFTDVADTAWYAGDVQTACELGLMVGEGEGLFTPEESLTVAEALTLAVRVRATYEGDVLPGQGEPWYQVYFDYAVSAGMADTGTLEPLADEPAGRALTAFLFSAALPEEELPAINEITSLPDVDEGTAYSEAIFFLYRAGVLTGEDEYGTFHPAESLTRAQAAAIIARVAVPSLRQGLTLQEPPVDTLSPLREEILQMLSGYAGTWSVYCKRMDTGESFCLGDSPMTAASLIKLYVYGATRRAIENGALNAASCESLLHPMITVSDNYSCNRLIDILGGFGAVNAFIADYGFADSVLNRKMLASGPENLTSTKDCGALLEMLLNNAFISPGSSAALLNDLRAQTRTGKIPAGVPRGVRTANKTGELTGVENDAAIVFSDACTYILCVMSDGVASGTAVRNIKNISGRVYAFLNQ